VIEEHADGGSTHRGIDGQQPVRVVAGDARSDDAQPAGRRERALQVEGRERDSLARVLNQHQSQASACPEVLPPDPGPRRVNKHRRDWLRRPEPLPLGHQGGALVPGSQLEDSHQTVMLQIGSLRPYVVRGSRNSRTATRGRVA
jgi:hypothetical protein